MGDSATFKYQSVTSEHWRKESGRMGRPPHDPAKEELQVLNIHKVEQSLLLTNSGKYYLP